MTTFAALFVPESLRAAVSDRAWLEAMLAAERALACAAAPADAAEVIAAACVVADFDIGVLAEEGRAVGNPVEPLVRALRERVGDDSARWVHVGATSQDILDSAAMLVAREARTLIDAELTGLAAACASLSREHRDTPMAARTLLQQAVPTTFGLKAAGWLVAVLDARLALRGVVLPAQLGGAAGTLASLGARGPDVVEAFARELGLVAPELPWHANRAPVARLGAALAEVAAAAATIGLDVVLLAQTEVGEVAEGAGGRSSTMPQKHNPVQAVLARACARGAQARVDLLTTGEHEHERAAGAWHAEWQALSDVLSLAGGAAAAARASLEGLVVDTVRMRANMSSDLTAERDTLVERGVLEPGDGAYLGSAGVLVDRALARFEASP